MHDLATELDFVPDDEADSGHRVTLAVVRPAPRAIATPAEIIEEARNGRMFILVDDEDRENEGDLVIPAQMITPDAINFMARHGRGLICLALSAERVEELRLPMMSSDNRTRHTTAFTVSIEAREGVSTGISAADRARTISVAVDHANGADALVTPGHVFPLMAKPGGVLTRAGHTEAAVDVARLAGLNPSGVICEIMKDDGSMARLDDLLLFAQTHGLKIGTIRDLIAYRRRHDSSVVAGEEHGFTSRWGGAWTARSFRNTVTGEEHVALVKGEIDPARPTLVRVHAHAPLADMFGATESRGRILKRAMNIIGEAGAGVLVVVNPCAGGIVAGWEKGPAGGDKGEIREYGVGAEILAQLGVRDMILLSNSHHAPVAIEAYGLAIVEQRPLGGQ